MNKIGGLAGSNKLAPGDFASHAIALARQAIGVPPPFAGRQDQRGAPARASVTVPDRYIRQGHARSNE